MAAKAGEEARELATVAVARGTLLSEAVRKAGLPIATGCSGGALCGNCGLRIVRGHVARESRGEREAKRRNRVDPALRLACRIGVTDDLEATADYW